MSLFKRGNTWHFVLRWNGQRYRGSCKTSRRTEAKKVEALVLARLLEDGRLPWNRKVPILADFSNRFFTWLESLPADRPPKPPTRRYYQVGWQLLESTSIARMKLDHITADHALTIEGSSAANTNNALRTLRRMLKKAQEWQLLSTVPIVRNNSPHHRPILPTQSHASRCFARLRGAHCATLIRRPWRRLFSAMVQMSFSASFLHDEHSIDAVLARDLTENDTEASQSTPHTALRPRRQAGTIPDVTRAYLSSSFAKVARKKPLTFIAKESFRCADLLESETGLIQSDRETLAQVARRQT